MAAARTEELQMRFGLFLVQRGRVTPEHVLHALDSQQRGAAQIGKLAVRERLLTPQQVFEILNYQIDRGLLFGEAGILLGYLTAAQVDSMLALQCKSRPRIGELLVQMGVIDTATLVHEIGEFGRSARERETVRPTARPEADAAPPSSPAR